MAKGRSIFEDVDAGSAAEAAKAKPVERKKQPKEAGRKGIVAWLTVLFVLVFAMIVVGGLTRLTDSGLSITEWKPVTGAVPPMNAEVWEAEFAKYRETPQFEIMNSDMTLEGFQTIYWWEWGHRQLGRLVGAVWFIGFLYFLARKQIPRGWTGRLLGLGALGGLQGAIGWWMVASGLTGEMVSVASYRLATHLGLAFAILGLIVWYVLRLRNREQELMQARRLRNGRLVTWGTVLICVCFAQIILGAMVAGIDAGRGHIDWPLMAGEFFPSDSFSITPAWRNFMENPGLVQFNHRMLGYILAILGLFAWLASRKSASTHIRRAFDAVGIAMIVQILLGIYTVINASPWQIAIVHQAVAVALFALIIRARFAACYPRADSLRRG